MNSDTYSSQTNQTIKHTHTKYDVIYFSLISQFPEAVYYGNESVSIKRLFIDILLIFLFIIKV